MIEWIKKHPWATGGIVALGVVLYYVWKNYTPSSGSSASGGLPVGGGYYPSYSGGGAATVAASTGTQAQAISSLQLPGTANAAPASTVAASDSIMAHDVPVAAPVGPTDHQGPLGIAVQPHGDAIVSGVGYGPGFDPNLPDPFASMICGMPGTSPGTCVPKATPVGQSFSGGLPKAGTYTDFYGSSFNYDPTTYSGGYAQSSTPSAPNQTSLTTALVGNSRISRATQ